MSWELYWDILVQVFLGIIVAGSAIAIVTVAIKSALESDDK